MMKRLLGGPGTISGFLLRFGQCAFGAASIAIMVTSFGFSSYTAFCLKNVISHLGSCYLIASMGLQVLWSFGLACLDIYALRRKRDLQNPILVSLFVVGDWVTATLSLAAACSSAGIVVLYARDLTVCATSKRLTCNRYQVSVAMAFLTWVLTAMSSHVMFWILASV
ncbi:CASP-like protein 5B2 isoform X1 [Glycine soja]|nr:CASP-like protein 5B2 isoform X1 [Glycine soja]RZC19452.1 CASP-like protein 5B2 isoform B [Glycine soja]